MKNIKELTIAALSIIFTISIVNDASAQSTPTPIAISAEIQSIKKLMVHDGSAPYSSYQITIEGDMKINGSKTDYYIFYMSSNDQENTRSALQGCLNLVNQKKIQDLLGAPEKLRVHAKVIFSSSSIILQNLYSCSLGAGAYEQ